MYFGVHSLAHGLIKPLLSRLSTPRSFAAVEMDVKNQGLHRARVQPPERASEIVQCRICAFCAVLTGTATRQHASCAKIRALLPFGGADGAARRQAEQVWELTTPALGLAANSTLIQGAAVEENMFI